MGDERNTLGKALRRIREDRGWTLKEMSSRSGIPFSTLTKVEHDRLSLTYDKLFQVSERLGISLAALFIDPDASAEPVPTARRSLGRRADAIQVETRNYDYHYLCTDLRRKHMIPIITRIRARNLDEFGPLIRHPGEEFIYVLVGRIEVHTDVYEPVMIGTGESIYIDSTMGHAYVLAEGCAEAETLGICFSPDDKLMSTFMEQHRTLGHHVVSASGHSSPPRNQPVASKGMKRKAG